MIGTHGNIIMAELIAKGLTNFDISTAYQGVFWEGLGLF